MTKVAILMLCLSLSASSLMALSPIAEFAAKQEETISKRVSKEKFPKRKLQMELLLRQDFILRLEQEKENMIRSGKLSTPEVEKLKTERLALVEQLTALDAKIIEASHKAPEIQELSDIAEANEKRIAALRDALVPELNSKSTQSKVTE